MRLNTDFGNSTGATGYIGGDVLSQLQSRHPEMTIRVMTRDEDKGRQIQDQYPTVQLVKGDLSNIALLQEESANADIIIRELTT